MTYTPTHLQNCTPWTLYRYANGQRFSNGTFGNKAEATGAIRQLQKLHPGSVFKPEFTGKSIPHCTDSGKAID